MYNSEYDLKFEMNLSLADVSSQVNIQPLDNGAYELEIESDIHFNKETIESSKFLQAGVVYNNTKVYINDLDDLYPEIVRAVSIAMSLGLINYPHPQSN
ncbi:hypothetical protein I5907_18460 [Panacibacter sp. DH6]|uniref:Uncharacterized protein n=1 Tax=Panacibacter microcysteis TaxID=2793269 RepID=A0A931GZM0_9BACT|nr:hypothetical protein [Panacibacter microcysteis]MBG9378228.1 hypothetical protein [Panacibacter microcysteis]